MTTALHNDYACGVLNDGSKGMFCYRFCKGMALGQHVTLCGVLILLPNWNLLHSSCIWMVCFRHEPLNVFPIPKNELNENDYITDNVFLVFFVTCLNTKLLLQILHVKGLFFLCFCMCSCKNVWVKNDFSHWSHSYFLISLWAFSSCLFKRFSLENPLLQTRQLNSFSSACVKRCLLRSYWK